MVQTVEYRIPLPLTVDEYRIAQLYMLAVSGDGTDPPTWPLLAACRKVCGSESSAVDSIELKLN